MACATAKGARSLKWRPQSGRLHERGFSEPGRLSPPIWPCTTRGFPCLRCCHRSGGLLPHLFTLAKRCVHVEAGRQARLFTKALIRQDSRNPAARRRHRLKSVLLPPWRYQARCPIKSSVDRSAVTIKNVRFATAIHVNAERSTCLRTVSGLSSRPGFVAAALRRHSSAEASDHPARPPL